MRGAQVALHAANFDERPETVPGGRNAATANRPSGLGGRDPRRCRHDLILRATGPEGDAIEVAGPTAEDAWRAMAE